MKETSAEMRKTEGGLMPDHCVYCLSDNISTGKMSSEGKTAFIEVSCNHCGKVYTELYTFIGIEGTDEFDVKKD